jgi:membrane peptidoglycan carboxypeptidase
LDKIYRTRRRRARQLVRQSGRTFRQRLMALATLGMFVILLGFMAAGATGVVLYRSYAADLKPPEQAIAETSVGTSLAYDRSGQKLYEYVDPLGGLRDPVPLTEMSPYLVAATVATEDASFYNNPGVNFRGLARAAIENLTPFGPGFLEGTGGSSITQQLVKNIYIERDSQGLAPRTVDRKLKETVIALELKRKYDDNQILEWYLNQISYGNFAFGAQAAAERYFGKNAKDLTLGEAALLAGLPQAPGRYTPAIPENREAAKARQIEVLDLIIKHLDEVNEIQLPVPAPAPAAAAPAESAPSQPGAAAQEPPRIALTIEQIEAAKQEPLNYIETSFDIQAPHFVFFVQDQVEKMCYAGLFKSPGGIPCDKVVTQGGLRITTTIDLGLNAIGQGIVEEEIAASEDRTGGHNASLVAIRPGTGEILAYVGSRSYTREDIDGQVDIASSLQSHGSTMKMFTYLKAFEDGWVPSTYVEDKPLYLDVGDGKRQVNNWNFSHLGTITVRKGVSESVNTTAVRTLMDVGEDRMRELAHRMGITDLRQGDCGPTITLGACEVKLVDQTFAYSVLANNGVMKGRPTSEDLPTGFRELDQVSVLKISDSEDNVLYEFSSPEERQVVDPAHAWMMTDILSKEAINWSRLSVDRDAAAKTGTSEEFRDGVVMGYTPDLTVGVWMGNADNSPMAPGTFSSQGVGPMWRRFMNEAHEYLNITARKFEKPANVTEMSCGGRVEVFKTDTPTVRSGACRGPSGRPGVTASPTPRGPVFPTDTPSPTPTEIPSETPTPTATAEPEPTPTPTGREFFYYTAREGDTIESIAALFGIPVEDLVAANGIEPGTPIEPGTVIVIPGVGGG